MAVFSAEHLLDDHPHAQVAENQRAGNLELVLHRFRRDQRRSQLTR